MASIDPERRSRIGNSQLGFRSKADIRVTARDHWSLILGGENQEIDRETNESKGRVGKKAPILGCGCLLALAVPLGVFVWMAAQLGAGLCSFPPYALLIELSMGASCS